jgi:hypothetical protein
MYWLVPAPLNGVEVFRAAREAADNVIYFLPRNCSVVQVKSQMFVMYVHIYTYTTATSSI